MKITDILDRLDSVSAMAVVIVIMIVFFILGWFISKRKDISDICNSWYQNRKRKDELLQMILNDHNRMKEYEDNRVNDRKQSLTIQKELMDSQTHLADKINEISVQLTAMQKKTDERFSINEQKTNKRIRAELKDKIMRAYRVYHEQQYWNEMEKEAFEDLVEEYNQVSGNSFVHKTIIPESCTWEIRPLK